MGLRNGDGACFWVPGLVNIQKNDGTSPALIGKSTINGPFSIAMLNYQRVMAGLIHLGKI